MPMPQAVPFSLPFEEALAFFAQKGFAMSPESWRDVWQQAHTRAFTVARVTDLDILRDIKSEVDRAIKSGVSLQEFKMGLAETLAKKGWFAPKGESPEIELPDGTIRKRLTPWRLETIYRTNIQTAYSVGRYKQMMSVADRRPYWEYKAILDIWTRLAHAAMNNKVYDYRHPIWNEWYPPNGFRCRCYVKSLSASDLKERGLVEEKVGTDLRPDDGWQYNPGASFMQWDRLPEGTVFKESPDQKSYRDFGRPDVRQVSDSLRQQAPELLPTAAEVGREASLEGVMGALGIPSDTGVATIATGDGELALLGKDQIEHLFDAGDGREKYASFILPTLEHPFEVYLTEYETLPGMSVWRKRYICLFKGEGYRDYVVILDQGRDGTIFWNAFTREKAKINKARVGELIYAEPL